MPSSVRPIKSGSTTPSELVTVRTWEPFGVLGLLSPNGYGTGIARLKLTRKDGAVTVDQQYYKNVPLVPFEDSSVLINGRFYACKGVRGGPLVCIDSSDGKDLWTARGSGSGMAAATYADGHL